MTRNDIDIMWSQALQQAIKDGEEFTRYHFAALVADAERKACAQLLRDNAAQCTKGSMNEYILTSNAQAIEARSKP